jgi:hypothetical protein
MMIHQTATGEEMAAIDEDAAGQSRDVAVAPL